MRRMVSLASTAALAVALAVLAATPAHAATAYTWTGQGTDHTYWSNAQNWSPNGVPTNGDSVSVGSLPGGPSDITAIPTVSLASLSIAETANNIYLDATAASTLTVTNSLSWSGGDISVPLTLAAGATGVITGQSVSSHLDNFGGGSGAIGTKKLTVAGSLTIVGVGIDPYLPPPPSRPPHSCLAGRDHVVVATGVVFNTTAGTGISLLVLLRQPHGESARTLAPSTPPALLSSTTWALDQVGTHAHPHSWGPYACSFVEVRC